MVGMNPPSVLDFRSSTSFALALVIYSDDMEAISHRLQEKIASAPGFFNGSPIQLDLSELNAKGGAIDVVALIALLRGLNFFPIGIRGADAAQEKRALELAVPIDSGSSHGDIVFPKVETEKKVITGTQAIASETNHTPAMMITQPVRSGQRIYATSDLVILAQVSAGAEIMAEGNIHVYNTLRGRALAGVQGNTEARLFCLDLQAELVSVAGIYKTSEDLKETFSKKPIQVYLQEQALIIEELS